MHTTITIKTDKKLRDEAKKTAARLGIPLTTAINAMLRQFVTDQEIVLSAKTPRAETQEALQEARDPKFLARAKRYTNASEMLRDIMSA